MKLCKTQFIRTYFKITCLIAFIINFRIQFNQYESTRISVNNASLYMTTKNDSNMNMIQEDESQNNNEKINEIIGTTKNFMSETISNSETETDIGFENVEKIMLLNKNSNIEKILISLRIKYSITRNIDSKFNKESIIIFDNSISYFKFQKQLKDQVGVIIISSEAVDPIQTLISNCYLNEKDSFLNEFLNITKFNNESIKINKYIKFDQKFNDSFYDQLKFSSKSVLKCKNENNNQVYDLLFTSIIDQIKHVFISYDNFDDIWLLKSLFLDALKYLSNNMIDISPKRFVLVDVDDAFLGKVNTSDVLEMIRLQDKLTKNYFNHSEYKFKLNLGFNGFRYNSTGDNMLIGIS